MSDELFGTLAAWCARHRIGPVRGAPGAVSIVVTGGNPVTRVSQWDLYHLRDYVVSSVSGPVVWLVPRVGYDVS